MPDITLRVTDEFIHLLSTIYSEPLLARIRRILDNLSTCPEMGSPNVRKSLIRQYGSGIRKIPISSFVIVYRYHGSTVDVLALVYGPSVS